MGYTYIQTHENSLVHGSNILPQNFMGISIPMKNLSTETFMGISQDNGNFMVIA